ncbi:MAG: hypothetical protein IT585_06505 [candidate division Zixibacteria bacterium]|nr:hypothetical protein [candidate division Zixibacteria bacterium]
MRFDAQNHRLTDSGKFGTIMLAIGVIGIAASIAGYFVDAQQFLASYLTAFTYWVSLGLGGLFFVMLHHLVNAQWSIVLRRIAENVMYALPLMIVFFLPVAFGLGSLYKWTDTAYVAADHLLSLKAGFLNTGFFLIRSFAYLVIWAVLAIKLYRLSLQQDQGHQPGLTKTWRKISAPGIIVFAITLTFASWDWLMSLDAHWYSTIFGAYYFAGATMAMMAFTLLTVLLLARRGILTDVITVEHYHDLAKLLFAFIVFWAYMGFSQYFLIWYANIPEETIWYQHRWVGSWKAISLLIVFGHFAVPFLLLITRAAKRSALWLIAMCVWMLFMHYIDLYWLVFPNFSHHGAHFSWMDLATMMAIGGVFVWYFWKRLAEQPLVPVNDPRLAASMKFVNQ